jgi:hypothetical protein
LQGFVHPQTGEAREVGVGRVEDVAALNRQHREMGVGGQAAEATLWA